MRKNFVEGERALEQAAQGDNEVLFSGCFTVQSTEGNLL